MNDKSVTVEDGQLVVSGTTRFDVLPETVAELFCVMDGDEQVLCLVELGRTFFTQFDGVLQTMRMHDSLNSGLCDEAMCNSVTWLTDLWQEYLSPNAPTDAGVTRKLISSLKWTMGILAELSRIQAVMDSALLSSDGTLSDLMRLDQDVLMSISRRITNDVKCETRCGIDFTMQSEFVDAKELLDGIQS